MNILSSPSQSLGGDRKSTKKTSTPTLTRAKNTSRRISVWMQQTWRERSIPQADFGNNHKNSSNNSAALSASQFRSSASLSSAASPTRIGSPVSGTPMSTRFGTPPAQNNLFGSPLHNNNTSNNNNVVILNPEQALVSNVDEALGAWTSLYKFQDHFPEMDATQEEDDIIDTTDTDWVLDGHQEWQEQYKRSQELLKTMYPGNSGNMLSDLLLATIGNETEGTTTENTNSTNDNNNTNNTSDSSNNNGTSVVDEESLLLLKFGSAMGQQEYQFASFETADFSNLASGPENVKNSNHKNGPEITDSSGTETTDEDKTESSQAAKESKHNENGKAETKADDPFAPDAKPPMKGDDKDGNADNDTNESKEASAPIHKGHAVVDAINTPVSAPAVESEKHENAAATAAASSDDDENFEEFWQSAMDMATPETGTFPSIGSRSTYVISPLVDDGLLSPPPARATSEIVLDCIYSQEDEGDDGDVKSYEESNTENSGGNGEKPINPDAVKGGLATEDGDGESDFGDFRDGSTPVVENQANSGAQDAGSESDGDGDEVENDFSEVPNELATMPQTESEPKQETLIDQSFDEDREGAMYHVNTSFETAATPIAGAFTARKNLSSSSPAFHTGITPLKKNGRCNTPITPSQTYSSPKPGYVNGDEEYETPLSHRLFHTRQEDSNTQGIPTGSPTETSMSARAVQAAEAAAVMQEFTPVTRNFRYWEPEDDDSAESPAQRRSRTMLMVPGSKNAKTTPERRFHLQEDMNKVMNGIPDEDSNIIENDTNDDIKSQEPESVTQGGEESLLDGSIQSSSIPSVVQLFTKSLDAERRSKIVVPNTVRATRDQGLSLTGAPDAHLSTNTGLTMPSFYFGRNQNGSRTSSKRRQSSEIVSLSASEVASASASIMSMPMMKNAQRPGSGRNKPGSEKLDEPSINSSIASPEVKFLRRNKQSKRFIRNRSIIGRQESSLSVHSRTSRTTDGYEDGTLGDPSQQHRHYGDPQNDFYHYYYGHDEDGAGSDGGSDDLTDEESLSLGSLSTLPNEYWKHPELDHTLRELTKLEWDWLPYWQMDRLLDDLDGESGFNMDNIPLLQDQITQKLSKLDSFYGKICKKVYRRIQPHSEALLSANQAALDLHQNLQLSQMYLSRSQESIELAKYGKIRPQDDEDNHIKNDDEEAEGIGVHGALRLIELWDIQHSYHDLCRVEKVISEISDLEATISQRIRCFDTYKENSLETFKSILDMSTTMEAKLAAHPADRLVCFDSMRGRSHNWISQVLVTRLHDCLSDIAVEWCLATDSSDSTLYVADGPAYSRLIEILLRINDSHEKNGNISSPLPTGGAHSNPVMAICTSIQTSLLMEIQKSFGRALLDPSDSEMDEKSEYEQELAALASNEAYLDASRLPIWTHNLVTIRFEFEMKQGGKQPLPAIFHKLCLLLTNVLCGMHRLIEWHNSSSDGASAEILGLSNATKIEIRDELRARRASVWNACVQSIEDCLQEYLNHSGKKELFSKKDGNHDDSGWRRELEGLHDISVLSHQFLSIRPLFLVGVPTEVVNDGSRIDETLYSCFKAHLRAFHVEAMNTLGTMFYREDWQVYSLEELQNTTGTRNSDEGDDSTRAIFESISKQLRCQLESQQTLCCRSQHNEFTKSKSESLDKNLLLTGDKNPFEVDREQMEAVNLASGTSPAESSWDDFCSDKRTVPILEILRTYIGGSDDGGSTSKIILKSVFEGVFPWTARLLVTIDKLPALAEEACKVMRSIVDLYVTTAFRLCAGNGKNERVLLGIDSVGENTAKQQNGGNARVHGSTSPSIFDFGMRSKPVQARPNRPAPVISATAEAELCALVLEESNGLEHVREFLVASQKRMEGVAKIDLVDGWIRDPTIEEDTIEEDFAEETARVLEKRHAASCNHLFVALGLFLATQATQSSSSFTMIHKYTTEVLDAVPPMITLSNRISCMRSIRGRALLREVISVGSGWEESKLHEQANEYVEEFCEFLALLWESLYAPISGRRLPIGILKTLWENILGGGYMVLLDGFSKVPYCSTEGRALMSMDVASFRSGTSPRSIAERLEEDDPSSASCPLPADIRPYRTMAYVDTYIKIFYFPSNDALEWIKTNYKQYHKHHILSLVINDRDARKLTKQITKYYGGNDSAQTIRI